MHRIAAFSADAVAIRPMSLLPHEIAGQRAEAKVLNSLRTLPPPWKVFPSVEWRQLGCSGESVGEADVVVFHPDLGLAIFEIKAGAVEVRDGQWFYSSGLPMKLSPFSQARRNRYALADKLKQRLGKDALGSLGITHATWFPDVLWHGAVPGTEIPSRSFLFDKASLNSPEVQLQKMWREATSAQLTWTKQQQQVLKELLAPNCQQLVSLSSRIDDTVADIHQATEQQIAALRLLRTQIRLLIEGGAGSGKTLLAVTLAREHAALDKKVLLTCFNVNLARQLANLLKDVPGITVKTFHDLTRDTARAAGLTYAPPTEPSAQATFYRDECPELLLAAAESGVQKFDSILVDEGYDFLPTWWVALEALGSEGFSWYCFYDRHQAIYLTGQEWLPPFVGTPLPLDANLRNTKPIGTLAAQLGHCPKASHYRIETGDDPQIIDCGSFDEMAQQLRKTLRQLITTENIAAERIVVLSPYRHTNPKSTWATGLDNVTVSTDMVESSPGKVRVGTIPGFKGLEAEIVILAGIDAGAQKRAEWLYVGASRAKAQLIILQLAGLSAT